MSELLAIPFLIPTFVFVALCLLLPPAMDRLDLPWMAWLLGPLLQGGISFALYYLADVLRPQGFAGSPPSGDHYFHAMLGAGILGGPFILAALVLGFVLDYSRSKNRRR